METHMKKRDRKLLRAIARKLGIVTVKGKTK